MITGHFRLPLHLKEEVNSVPPDYKLIWKLDYDSLAKAEKSLPSYGDPEEFEVCKCEDYCGSSCLNRLMKIECYDLKGNKSADSTCAVGIRFHLLYVSMKYITEYV